MKKSNPTVTVSMSMTQEDMNSFIRQKMDKAQKVVIESQKRREPPEHTCRVSRYRDVPSKHVRKVNSIVLRAAEISTRTFVLVHVCAKRTSLGAMILPAVS